MDPEPLMSTSVSLTVKATTGLVILEKELWQEKGLALGQLSSWEKYDIWFKEFKAMSLNKFYNTDWLQCGKRMSGPSLIALIGPISVLGC